MKPHENGILEVVKHTTQILYISNSYEKYQCADYGF